MYTECVEDHAVGGPLMHGKIWLSVTLECLDACAKGAWKNDVRGSQHSCQVSHLGQLLP